MKLALRSVRDLASSSSGQIYAAITSVGGHGPADGGLIRSNDDGITWVDTLLWGHPYGEVSIDSFGRIFVVSGFGQVLTRSTDGGTTFVRLAPEPPVTVLGVGENGLLFAGSYAYVRHWIKLSSDGGDSWADIWTGPSDLYLNTIAVNSSGTVFVGTVGSGCFHSTDCGNHWITDNSGLTNLNVQRIVVDSGDNIYLVTQEGLFQSTRSIDGTGCRSQNVPELFILKQNSPNPFHSKTTIRYSLPQPAFVELEIIDATGRIVCALVSETVSAGDQEVVWEPQSVADGVYFVRLKVNQHAYSRKAVLFR